MQLKQIINFNGIFKILDNLCDINCYVVNLYKGNWLTEVPYWFGLVFFVKMANLGYFYNAQNYFRVRQQHEVKPFEIQVD